MSGHGRDDLSELPLLLADLPEGYDTTVEAHLRDGRVITCRHVDLDPVRYRGWWHISHTRGEQSVTTMIPVDEVSHFVTVTTDPPEELPLG